LILEIKEDDIPNTNRIVNSRPQSEGVKTYKFLVWKGYEYVKLYFDFGKMFISIDINKFQTNKSFITANVRGIENEKVVDYFI